MPENNSDTISVMMNVAKIQGILGDKSLGFIPELSSTIEKSTAFFHQIALDMMSSAAQAQDPQAGVAAMQRICIYMFAKGVEAVMLWADSPDGNISIGFEPSELSDLNIQTDLDPKRREIVLSCFPLGDALFQAHNEFMVQELTTPPGHDEAWCHEEMEKAIRWSMQFGIGYALTQGYQA